MRRNSDGTFTVEPQSHRHYINGEEVEYTGQSQMLHGATCYEVRVVGDSPRLGAVRWTYNPPKGA